MNSSFKWCLHLILGIQAYKSASSNTRADKTCATNKLCTSRVRLPGDSEHEIIIMSGCQIHHLVDSRANSALAEQVLELGDGEIADADGFHQALRQGRRLAFTDSSWQRPAKKKGVMVVDMTHPLTSY